MSTVAKPGSAKSTKPRNELVGQREKVANRQSGILQLTKITDLHCFWVARQISRNANLLMRQIDKSVGRADL